MLPAPSMDELVGIGLAAAQSSRETLLLDEGDIAEQDIVSSAAMGMAVLQRGAQLNRQTYLEGCEDEEVLDQRILDRYNLARLLAANALVTLSITRATAAAGAGTIDAGSTFATVIDSEGTRQEFVTTVPLNWGGAETGTKTVPAQAVIAGKAGNVAAASITQKVSTLFDSSFTVTNVARAAGGADKETNEQYIARARQYPATLARGTKAAVEFGGLQVPGVRVSTATEDEDTGIGTLYIADASGGSNAELEALVIIELENWRPIGSTITVTGGELLEQDVTVEVTMLFGEATDLATVIENAITDELARLGAGETLYRARIVHAVINSAPDRIRNVTVTTPAADVEPDPQQIIRVGTVAVEEA